MERQDRAGAAAAADPESRAIFDETMGHRAAGFVFVGFPYAGGAKKVSVFPSAAAFRSAVQRVLADLDAGTPGAGERDRKRAVVAFCRVAGQVPEKAVRLEFLKLTRVIGSPEFTRAHDLRHLFASRAQAAGVNPILVQEMLGHTTLEMTRRYTHLGLDSKREALLRLEPAECAFGRYAG